VSIITENIKIDNKRYKNCRVCDSKLLPMSIYDYSGFCYLHYSDGESSLTSESCIPCKLVYRNISGENEKNIAIPVSKVHAYKEVQFKTGDFIEQYTYSRLMFRSNNGIGRKKALKDKKQKKQKTKLEVNQYREEMKNKKIDNFEVTLKQLNRKKKEIRRTINTNCRRDNKYLCSFFTATYQENQVDEYQAREDFNKFIKRLQYNHPVRTDLKRKRILSFNNYLYCLERQERGAIHFHVIFFDCPYLHYSEFAKQWGKGSIDVHCIRNIHRVGSYIVKYLTSEEKHQKNNPILGKTWSKSQNLEMAVRDDYLEYQDLSKNNRYVFQGEPYLIPDTDIKVIFTLFEKSLPPN